jgi:hypothetical protein
VLFLLQAGDDPHHSSRILRWQPPDALMQEVVTTTPSVRVARAVFGDDGTLYIGAYDPNRWQPSSIYISRDLGVTVEETVEGGPEYRCFEFFEGRLYACSVQWLSDQFAVGSSGDARAWAPEFDISELKLAECTLGTCWGMVHSMCEASPAPADCAVADAGVGGATLDAKGSKNELGGGGCACSMPVHQNDAPGWFLVPVGVLGVQYARRRRGHAKRRQ